MKDGQVVKDELNAFEQKHVKNETKVQNAAFKVGDKIKTKGKVGEVTDIDSRSVGAFGDVVTYKMKWPDGTESWEGNLHVLGTKVNEVEEEVKVQNESAKKNGISPKVGLKVKVNHLPGNPALWDLMGKVIKFTPGGGMGQDVYVKLENGVSLWMDSAELENA